MQSSYYFANAAMSAEGEQPAHTVRLQRAAADLLGGEQTRFRLQFFAQRPGAEGSDREVLVATLELSEGEAFTFNLVGLPTSNIRMQPEAGGGGLLDVGCYTTYAIRWWMGAEPVKVFAKAVFANGVDVAMSGVWTFADGRTANFDCGFTAPLRTWVEILGTEAVVRVPNMWIPDDQAVFQVVRQAGDFGNGIEEIATPGENQMVHMLDDFAAAVREKREPYPNPGEAVKTLKVLDALKKSAFDGKEVEL